MQAQIRIANIITIKFYDDLFDTYASFKYLNYRWSIEIDDIFYHQPYYLLTYEQKNLLLENLNTAYLLKTGELQVTLSFKGYFMSILVYRQFLSPTFFDTVREMSLNLVHH